MVDARVGDIEAVVQWAMAQSGALPWRATHPRELMIDGGYTVVPKGCASVYRSRGLRLACPIDDDARRVIQAIMALDDAAAAATVIACGRGRVRPDWMPGVEPVRVPLRKRDRRRHRRKLVGYCWRPCPPEAICAAHEVYRRWYRALQALTAVLAGTLDGWEIIGLSAPAEPWECARKKTLDLRV